MDKPILALAAAGIAIVIVACSSDSTDDPGAEQRAKEAAARQGYESDLAWLDRTYDRCQDEFAQTGTCVIPASEETGMQPLVIHAGSLKTQDLAQRLRVARDRARAFSDAVRIAATRGACALLAPLADSQSPYVWMGTSVSAGAIVGTSGSVDVVFDLRRKQAAVFTGAAVTLGTQFGVGANAYVGMAFGACNDPNQKDTNLVEAWNTPNCSAGVSISTPFDLLSVDVQAMTTANGCMRGGTIGAGVGWSPDPLPIEGGVSWPVGGGAWNTGTNALSKTGWGSRSVECRERNPDKSCKDGQAYVQFGSARAMALHMVSQMGVAGVVPAATVLALDQLERRGLTIEQMCPNEVAADRAKRTPPAAIQAICNPAMLIPDGGILPPTTIGSGQPAGGGPRPDPADYLPPPSGTGGADAGSGADAGDAGTGPCGKVADGDYCGYEIGWPDGNTRINCRYGNAVAIAYCPAGCELFSGHRYCYEH